MIYGICKKWKWTGDPDTSKKNYILIFISGFTA